MRKIVLPTDFSDNAWNAIAYALEFFKNEKCEFHILHTYTPTFYRADYMMGGPTYSAIPDMGVDMAQAGLEKTVADIHKNFDNPKHRFKSLSAFNTLVNELQELCAKNHYDLIVMGTQGATGVKEIFLGTHTVHVIRKSTIPVLAIPVGYVFREIESILFPSDYGMPFNDGELQLLMQVTTMQHALLTVLNVRDEYELTEDQKLNKNSLADYLKKRDHTFVQVHGKLTPNAIQEYIEQHKIGLLAMVNRKHSFWDRLVVKQTIDTIGYHVQIPFLVMPDSYDATVKKTT